MQLTQATLVLMSGRIAGAAVVFAIPLVLVRLLDVHEFGTYRTLFLLYGSFFVIAQMGMSESLYYFVPRRPEAAGSYVSNAFVTLVGLGAVAVGAGVWLAPAVADWTGNATVGWTLPLLSWFLGIMLLSAALEMVMVARKRYTLAATTYATSDVIRAAALILPVVWWRSLEALLVGALGFALVRLLLMVWFLRHEFGRHLRLDRALWRQQAIYALPFGSAVIIEIAQVNLHQYAVLSWFDTATFAIYSVGCLQIPIVEWLSSSAGNVMMVQMGEQVEQGRAPLALWHHTVVRLALVFLPMMCLFFIAAPDLLVLMFTEAYAAAAPVFMVSVLMIGLAVLPVDAVLRVYAQTRFIFGMNVFRLTFIAATIAWFVSRFGVVGAILVTVLATAISKTAATRRIKRLLGASVRDMLPWRALAGTFLAAVLAAIVASVVRAWIDVEPLAGLVVLGVIYAGVYGAALLGARGAHWMRLRLPLEEPERSV
jgi:O-antigen/teichoic acid export membrane protein